MNFKIITVADNALQIQIDKEDYSLADIIHKELLNVKHVKFSGVPPPHPLIKTLTVQVHTDGSGNPTKALKEAMELSQERVAELLKISRQIFPEAPPVGSSASSTPRPVETNVEVIESPQTQVESQPASQESA